MTKKGNNRNFGVFNSLFRYAPQRIEHSKNYLQKVVIHYCEKLVILHLLFTIVEELLNTWGEPDESLIVTWPLRVKIWKYA